MSNQICLKWNSFLNNIATNFESLWEEEGLIDVTLASDGQCLTAHKVILSASSPFFKKVFQTNPCQHPIIILQDVHFSELEALLIFIYKGEVNIEQNNLPALLKAAETLQIRGLSGGDILAKEPVKRLADFEQIDSNESILMQDVSRKKQKITKMQNDLIVDKAIEHQVQIETDDCSLNFKNFENSECALTETLPSAVYSTFGMKVEGTGKQEGKVHQEDVKEEDHRGASADIIFQKSNVKQKDEPQRSSKATVTVIAEARHLCSPSPESPACSELPDVKEDIKIYNPSNLNESTSSLGRSSDFNTSRKNDCLDSLLFLTNYSLTPNTNSIVESKLHNSTSSSNLNSKNLDSLEHIQHSKGGPSYPPFPCPFCDRAYTSWGFRRRHIKAVHTLSPKLNCKWCLQVLPTHAAWRRHVISAHNLSPSDAHNGLLILEEAHMVLQIAHPTRLDKLVDIIKESSQQSS